MKKIKLLHISRPTEFGLYRFLMDLIKYTDKDRFEIVMACPEQGPLLKDLRNEGIRVIPIEMRREINFVDDIKSFFSILHMLKKEKWDIVHTHCSKAGFLGRIAARLVGIPVIIYTPNSWYFDEPLPSIKKKFYIFLERFAAYFGDRIVTVTEEERKEIIRKKIAKPNQIITIYDGIDIDFLKEDVCIGDLRGKLGLTHDDKIVGMIARLVPQKSPLDFVRAADKVLKIIPDVKFIIVGDGPLREKVESLCQQLSIEDKVILVSTCHERRDINKFFNLIDISVLTSSYEGLPLVALQSMYLKKPVVITKVRGIAEVIENNKDGLIVPISDINAIAQAIIFLLRNEDRARQIGVIAHEKVKEYFTAEKMARKYEELHTDILFTKGTRGKGERGCSERC